MGLQQFSAYFLIAVLSIFLAACGGSSSDGFWSETNTASDTVSGDENTSASISEDVTIAKQLGRLDGQAFVAGELSVTTQNLEAFESTSISGVIYDVEGNPYLESASINFSSACSDQGLATLTTPQSVSNGEFKTVYTATGCVGEDIVTATAFIDGKRVTATISLQVEAATIHAIRFESASPSSINIKNFGGIEESIVKFKLVDKEGRTVAGQKINFSVNTSAGGIALSELSRETDASGVASTVIHSGTTATTVRVTATLADNQSIFATSDAVTISTGVADQNSITLSASAHNPEAWNIVGNEVRIGVMASDHFNNPVPDGIRVYFTTEGGQIEPNCTLVNGSCSVIWRSGAPYPCHARTKILAVMTGEESFIDSNGNAVLDEGEIFYDMAEAFRDDNENGQFDEGKEEFWDFNQNGQYDLADGKYNGVLCNAEENPNCSADKKNIYVRDSLDLVMAGSNARLQLLQGESGIIDQLTVDSTGASATLAMSSYLGRDTIEGECVPPHEDPSMYQPMPVGTKVDFELKKGELLSESSYVLGSTSASSPHYFPVYIAAPDDQIKSGETTLLTVKVETAGANDIEGSKTYAYFPVVFDLPTDDGAGDGGTGTGDGSGDSGTGDTGLGYVQVPSSMRFASSDPSSIGISGFGMVESSKITFQLNDQKGNPIAGEKINFSLNTSVGGIALSESSSVTDQSGNASVYVNAGTVATSVRVMAVSESDSSIRTQSDALVVSTGIADQNSFTIYADSYNPEALDWANTEVNVHVIASDHFNNPVPDGSSVYFTTEGGQIESECQTQAGRCSVKWFSSYPYPDDARVTILATMLGEESFTDTNGNGIQDGNDPFDDLGEAFVDINENGVYDFGREEFKDFNNNATWDAPDGKYNGVLCAEGSCSTNKNVYVRGDIVLVLSGSEAELLALDSTTKDAIDHIQLSGNHATVDMIFSDRNGHPLPKGTTIKLEAGAVSVVPSSITIPSTNSVQAATRSIALSANNLQDTALLEVTMTTPNGIVTVKTMKIHP